MKIKVITDSCCDLPLQYAKDKSPFLEIMGMPVSINGTEHIDDLGQTLDHETFYKMLRNDTVPTTSQINAYRFEETFRKYLSEGYQVIYIGFSSAMSGTFNSAKVAESLIKEDNPDSPLWVTDTLSASIGLGALIMEVVALVEKQESISTINQWIKDHAPLTQHWFGVDNLDYLKKGGRISTTSAMVGNVLNVKPTLIVDSTGKLKSYGKVRGRKKSIQFLASKVDEFIDPKCTKKIIVGHGNCPDDAQLLIERIRENHPNLPIILSELSMTIASHVGPDMLALAFVGKTREL